jgi:hypothetical protein
MPLEHFYPEYREGKAFLRVPLWKVKDLTEITADQIESQVRQTVLFPGDFYQRVAPAKPRRRILSVRVHSIVSANRARLSSGTCNNWPTGRMKALKGCSSPRLIGHCIPAGNFNRTDSAGSAEG